MDANEIKKEITDEADAKNREYAKGLLKQALEDVERSERVVKEAQADVTANKIALTELEAAIEAGEIKRPVTTCCCDPRYIGVTWKVVDINL